MSTTAPAISVVLPVRDGGPLLARAVQSILGQTLGALELIVVDDGSRDRAVAALCRDDQRLRVVRSPGRGLVAALNHGLRLARAPLLARMDADDWSHPRRLQVQAEFLRGNPRIAVAGTQVRVIHADGTPGAGYLIYENWINGLTTPEAIAREIFVESPIPHPSAMIRTTVLREAGGYRVTDWAEDYDLWLRLHGAGHRFGKPLGVLLEWRDYPARTSRTDPTYGIDRFIRAKAHFLARGPLRDRSSVIWGAGPTGATLCDALLAEGARVEGFFDIDRRKIGGRKRGRPVWPASALQRAADRMIVAAVGARGARADIRATLNRAGRREGDDYLCAA